MKVLSAILVAVSCLTIVSAAPSSDTKYSLTKLNFDDIENEVLFDLNDESEPVLAPLLKNAGKIKCAYDVVTEAWKDNEIVPKWKETKKDFEELQNRFMKCMVLRNKWAIAMCVANETKNGLETLKKLFATLRDAEGSYNRIKNTIKEKCFSDNPEIMELM